MSCRQIPGGGETGVVRKWAWRRRPRCAAQPDLAVDLLPGGDRIVDRITHGIAGRVRRARPRPPCNTPDVRCPGDHTRGHHPRRHRPAAARVRLRAGEALVQPGRRRAGGSRDQVVWSAPRSAVADARVGWHRLNRSGSASSSPTAPGWRSPCPSPIRPSRCARSPRR
ncbi:hypothetical protein NKG94_33455 [Micromonospora sp. M12]